MDGYDHIIDIGDDEPITHIASMRGHSGVASFLDTIPEFEMNREKLHRAIRTANVNDVKYFVDLNEKLAAAKNYFGRCALHIAVLREQEEIVQFLCTKIKSLLLVGDNVSQ